jgi:hypothetical protein
VKHKPLLGAIARAQIVTHLSQSERRGAESRLSSSLPVRLYAPASAGAFSLANDAIERKIAVTDCPGVDAPQLVSRRGSLQQRSLTAAP